MIVCVGAKTHQQNKPQVKFMDCILFFGTMNTLFTLCTENGFGRRRLLCESKSLSCSHSQEGDTEASPLPRGARESMVAWVVYKQNDYI